MRVRTMGRTVAMLAVLAFAAPFALLSASAASALDQPKTPQPVADFFADGLIPRLIDLYGSGDGVTKGVDFDASTRVGAITRVREWTPEFLSGHASDEPTRLTNDWVAPVSVHGAVLGLAIMWINPADDEPELASFESSDVAHRVGLAPQGSWLVHDPDRGAWFAMTEEGLIPLIAGTSGATELISPAAYQRLIGGAVPEEVATPSGVSIAALVLGIVIVGVVVFVLLPVRRKGQADQEGEDEPDEPDGSD